MEEFLKDSYKYRLGEMSTEKPHPKTQRLSQLSQENLPEAIDILKAVDVDALEQLLTYSDKIEKLKGEVEKTLDEGGRIYLCGCGATGRLSLLLEYLWREKNPNSNQVVSLMAGGDVALVHSLEGFEDYPEYGERHLKQLGFTENDLLISTTEGGETPYVIGATEAAAEISHRKPFFLYCNPDNLLCEKVERSKKVICNSGIEKICLFVGPMALSGSTRMQASTVLQLAVGLCLVESENSVEASLQEFIHLIKETDFSVLEKFIIEESEIYKAGEHIMYSPEDYGITVFTDTTERSPTFSLPEFESPISQGKVPPSLCYIMFPQTEEREESWELLLNRAPRPINWPEIDGQTTSEYLESFDFSKKALEFREKSIQAKSHHFFKIKKVQNTLSLRLNECTHQFIFDKSPSLFQHTLLKLIMNTHSTLVMGRLSRYKSNIMTWVKPTNGKLIDRSARYIDTLLQEENIKVDYEDIIRRIFEQREEQKIGESIVLKTVNSFIESK